MRDEGAIFRWWNRRTLVLSAFLMIILVFIEDGWGLDPANTREFFKGLFLYLLMTFSTMVVVCWAVNWVVAGTIVMDEKTKFLRAEVQTEGQRLMKLYDATGSIEEDE